MENSETGSYTYENFTLLDTPLSSSLRVLSSRFLKLEYLRAQASFLDEFILSCSIKYLFVWLLSLYFWFSSFFWDSDPCIHLPTCILTWVSKRIWNLTCPDSQPPLLQTCSLPEKAPRMAPPSFCSGQKPRSYLWVFSFL